MHKFIYFFGKLFELFNYKENFRQKIEGFLPTYIELQESQKEGNRTKQNYTYKGLQISYT